MNRAVIEQFQMPAILESQPTLLPVRPHDGICLRALKGLLVIHVVPSLIASDEVHSSNNARANTGSAGPMIQNENPINTSITSHPSRLHVAEYKPLPAQEHHAVPSWIRPVPFQFVVWDFDFRSVLDVRST